MAVYRRNRPRRANLFRTLAYASQGFQGLRRFTGRVSSMASRGRSGTSMRRRGTTSGVGVTQQFDTRQIYRRKRMPYYKKRRWVRAIKTNRALDLKESGTQTALIAERQVIDATDATQDNQFWLGISMYGKNGNNSSSTFPDARILGSNDLIRIYQQEGHTNPDAIFHFGSSVLDMTMNNTGNVKLEVDVYMVYTRSTTSTENFAVDQVAAVNATNPSGVLPKLSLTTRGTTPFELTQLTKQGHKIYSKRKYFLEVGEVATYQVRDPRNYKVNGIRIGRNSEWVLPGLTKMVLIVAKKVPQTFVADQDASLTVGCTRKYMYKILGRNEDSSYLLP